VAFSFWCVTDAGLKPEHVVNSRGRIISSWGILSVVLVQIVLWALAGFFASWIVPHLPHLFITGWRLPLVAFASELWQWFALLMVLQYVWILASVTARTAVIAVMAASGFRPARQSLDDARWLLIEMERKAGLTNNRLEKMPQPQSFTEVEPNNF
jgi:hypothetical protein